MIDSTRIEGDAPSTARETLEVLEWNRAHMLALETDEAIRLIRSRGYALHSNRPGSVSEAHTVEEWEAIER